MSLILSGGGKGKQTKKLDSLFFKLVGKNKIIFIPHSREKEEFNDSFNWVKENLFFPYDHKNFDMWIQLENKSIKDLKGVGGIILGGGNTFRLLKELKDSHFFEILKRFIKDKGVTYGISAGAIVLAKNIIPASIIDENKLNLTDMRGLNLLNNLSIFCHYNPEYDDEIFRMIKEKNMRIIGLPEGTGLFVNNKIEIIGSESSFIFVGDNKKQLKPGEILDLD